MRINFKSTIILLALILGVSLCVKTEVMAATNCKYSGCTRKPVPGPNRDGYCSEHSPRYNHDTCKYPGCGISAYYSKGKYKGYCLYHAGSKSSSSTSSTSSSNSKSKTKVKTTTNSKNCLHSGCTRQPVPGPDRDGYCSEHSPRYNHDTCKYPGCDASAYYTKGKYKGYCNNHAWIISGQTPPSSKKKNSSTQKKTTTGKKSTKMPDCDDYDSYKDFMDDWDGKMPDGSDAEDYWENW